MAIVVSLRNQTEIFLRFAPVRLSRFPPIDLPAVANRKWTENYGWATGKNFLPLRKFNLLIA